MIRSCALALLLALAGCSDPPPPTETYTVRGIYLGVMYDSAAALVEHEAIPGFMAAMRMPFRVAEPALLRGLSEGDKIEFLIQDIGSGYAMQSLDVLPATTTLDLDAGPGSPEERVPPDPALAP